MSIQDYHKSLNFKVYHYNNKSIVLSADGLRAHIERNFTLDGTIRFLVKDGLTELSTLNDINWNVKNVYMYDLSGFMKDKLYYSPKRI